MSLADLNVLSTNYEGISGVALESMASGRPFIGTDVEGVNDVVPDNQFLFPRQDHKALAMKIVAVANNKLLERYLIDNGLEHIKGYDIDIMVDKILFAYKSMQKK
jgi:glycosyltransferase involved in cell wall biosynthesis